MFVVLTSISAILICSQNIIDIIQISKIHWNDPVERVLELILVSGPPSWPRLVTTASTRPSQRTRTDPSRLQIMRGPALAVSGKLQQCLPGGPLTGCSLCPPSSRVACSNSKQAYVGESLFCLRLQNSPV